MPIQVEELNQTNCKTYLLSAGGKALLVDPVRERVPTYLREIAERHLELTGVLETHTHADHLMLNRELKQALGAPVFMHRASPSPLVDRHLEEGQHIDLDSEQIEVWHTPGHTPDSVCFVLAGAVLTGDTLLDPWIRANGLSRRRLRSSVRRRTPPLRVGRRHRDLPRPRLQRSDHVDDR